MGPPSGFLLQPFRYTDADGTLHTLLPYEHAVGDRGERDRVALAETHNRDDAALARLVHHAVVFVALQRPTDIQSAVRVRVAGPNRALREPRPH